MRFLYPETAAWLIALPVVWIAWLAHRWYRERSRRVSGFGSRVRLLSRLGGMKRDIAVVALASVAVAALLFAAARVQLQVRTPQFEQLDVIVALDRSASMQASDVRPSRLLRASTEIRNFLRNRPDNISRVGLIGFAGTSVVLSHLTRDPEILLFYLDWIEGDREPRFDTDLAGALENALNMVQKDQPQRRKIIIVVSDGEDHSNRLERAIAGVQQSRTPVYTIGVGSDSAVAIPTVNLDGVGAGMLRDDQGAVLTTRYSEDTLRRIAGVTAGRYFRSVSGQELGSALADISERERRVVQWRTQYSDLYPYGLAIAVIALSGLLIIL